MAWRGRPKGSRKVPSCPIGTLGNTARRNRTRCLRGTCDETLGLDQCDVFTVSRMRRDRSVAGPGWLRDEQRPCRRDPGSIAARARFVAVGGPLPLAHPHETVLRARGAAAAARGTGTGPVAACGRRTATGASAAGGRGTGAPERNRTRCRPLPPAHPNPFLLRPRGGVRRTVDGKTSYPGFFSWGGTGSRRSLVGLHKPRLAGLCVVCRKQTRPSDRSSTWVSACLSPPYIVLNGPS